MNNKKPEPTFIPCGDSMEKITQIDEAALENVSGGNDPAAGDSFHVEAIMVPEPDYSSILMCARCRMDFVYDRALKKYVCPGCGTKMDSL